MISKGVLKRSRRLYEVRWNRPWPHDDALLTELILEAKASLGLAPNAKHRYDEVYEEVLTAMRSDHQF